jgi:signal transduction histidine kinase
MATLASEPLELIHLTHKTRQFDGHWRTRVTDKVLIVEDEKIIAMELEQQIKQLGYAVIGPVASGEAALKSAEIDRPDLVLMDIRIQGPADGIETAEAIRYRFGIPVIYLTAHADQITLQRAKMTEPLGYLLKPWREHELLAAITVALHKHKMNKALEQRQADFLAMLTHDIQNPLQLVLGYADVLAEELSSSGLHQAEQLLNQMRDNILSTSDLVVNYSTSLALEGGRFPLVSERVQINEILGQVETRYVAEAARRDLSLETKLAGNLPLVEGDALALERVFANLIHNALKFTPQGGQVLITSSQQGETVAVSVRDTGPGIPPEQIPALFEKYWRHKRHAHHDGSGLGLFIVKSLVEAQGGRVEVESALAIGTCFKVILPVPSLPAGAKT